MRAITYRKYGSPDVLRLERIDKPIVGDDSVLVRIHAAAANPYDWHFMRGEPYFMRLFIGLRAPKEDRLGVDFAGRLEAVGKNVTHLRPGDEVFGLGNGTFAEYVTAPANQVASKPEVLSFEQAAAVPLAALTALQGLRDVARLEPGQRVLIIGASGGVGTFAVQIAKALGAEVAAVCSTRNLELVRSLGVFEPGFLQRHVALEQGQSGGELVDGCGVDLDLNRGRCCFLGQALPFLLEILELADVVLGHREAAKCRQEQERCGESTNGAYEARRGEEAGPHSGPSAAQDRT